MHIRIKKDRTKGLSETTQNIVLEHPHINREQMRRAGQNIDPAKIGGVIVALDEYENPAWRLYHAVSDAIKWRKLLKSVYFVPPQNIKILYNQEATKLAILETLKDAVSKYDFVCFYFSGHGYRVANQDADGKYVEGIVCYDHAWSRGTMIIDQDLREILSKAKRSWVVVDACHSAGITRGDGEIVYGRIKSIRGPGEGVRLGKALRTQCKDIVELAACQSAEVAYELDDGGVFTSHLVAILEKNPDVSFAELQEILREKIKLQTPNIFAQNYEISLFEMN